ncbi:MAG: 2-phospho-L-lactate transferase [Gammaproteobacteria bacterium]|nr:2-phospho-L-lactate transferase [Gammaproteobacteria bacterium]NND55262.1 2-phospho-L-lactate transferase [Gammaproteobacteria bacterium]
MSAQQTYTVLSGGVGGAKLVLGLQEVLRNEQLDVIANTGDDFRHLGLTICPDIDTLLYTLSGNANPETGWGRRDERWVFMETLEQLGGETWFRLGDRDLATHITRQALLDSGLTLSEVTRQLATALRVDTRIHPMSDDPLRTRVVTADGELEFQDYFVRQRAEPVATGIHFAGADGAAMAPGAAAALTSADNAAIIISPSNPWLSIAPILAVPGLQSTLLNSSAPTIAVSPVVAGKAIKGPTAKLMRELGVRDGVLGIAEHYAGIIDALIIDRQDAEYEEAIKALGLRVGITDTVMKDLSDKTALAQFVIEFAATVAGRARGAA